MKLGYNTHMQISIASDHAGFDMKNTLVAELRRRGHDVHDHGAHELIPDDDYPIYIAKVAADVSQYEESRHNGSLETHTVLGELRGSASGSHNANPGGHGDVVGIVIGGSGQGEAMAANKFPFVRAAVVYGGQAVGGSQELVANITRLSRLHNDSNVLSLGARFLSDAEAIRAVDIWLETSFSEDGKYSRRNDEVEGIEMQIESKF